MSALGDEDIRGLDVAVHDPLRMRGVEGVGNLNGQGKNRVGLHRAIADLVLQRHAVQILHDDEVLTFALVNLEHHADVGMIQRRSCLRFALESCQCLCVLGHIVRQEFESHEAMQLYILSFVNHTHPATT